MKNVFRFISSGFLLLAFGFLMMSATLLLNATAPRDIYYQNCFPTLCPNGMCTASGSVTATNCKITGCDNEEGFIDCK